MSNPLGKLFLVPTPLDFGAPAAQNIPLGVSLPQATIVQAAQLQYWITENAKSARAFLKRVGQVEPLRYPLQELKISNIAHSTHKHGDHLPSAALQTAAQELLAPALQGHDVGLCSEAGMPAIADPGSSIVRLALHLGICVQPLVGPVSLTLALAASGLNGQSFAFVGYLPQHAEQRALRIASLEKLALRTGQTQICIETPYRNAALLQALLTTLQTSTYLAVVSALGLPEQSVTAAHVGLWRKQALTFPLQQPSIFLWGI